eukprot:CFRG5146T1
MVKVGDKLPEGSFKVLKDGALKDVTVSDVFDGKKVVVLGIPGALTPTCSKNHLPSYVEKSTEIRNKGVDDIVCLAVNDAFVMDFWSKEQGAEGKVTLLADGDASWHVAADLSQNTGGFGGVRAKRYSMIVENGVVKSLNIEPAKEDECSYAPSIIKQL